MDRELQSEILSRILCFLTSGKSKRVSQKLRYPFLLLRGGKSAALGWYCVFEDLAEFVVKSNSPYFIYYSIDKVFNLCDNRSIEVLEELSLGVDKFG